MVGFQHEYSLVPCCVCGVCISSALYNEEKIDMKVKKNKTNRVLETVRRYVHGAYQYGRNSYAKGKL